jgi:tryptophanyl-tRNA synthetase
MRERRKEILSDPGYVEMVLREGREKANHVANGVMTRVRAAVGL